MRYTDNELKSMSYPLGENELEKCIAVFELVVSECKRKGFKSKERLKGGTDGANYSCELEKAGEVLKIQIVGAYAENTVGDKNSPVSIALVTQTKAAAEELKESLESSYERIGAKIGNTGIVTLGGDSKGFRSLVGYVEGDACLMLMKNGLSKRYFELDLAEQKRKHKATGYSFKKMVRLFKAIAATMLKEGVPAAKGICPLKLGNILCALSDESYERFDELSLKLAYIVLQAELLLEQETELKEANGHQKIFADAQEQIRYASFLTAMRSWLN